MRAVLRQIMLVLLASLLLLAAVPPLSAYAEGEGEQLAGVLETLTWGAPHEDVLKYAEAKLTAEFDKKAKDADTYKRDKLRQQLRQDVQKVAETYKELKAGQNSGLELSIVSGEFIKGNNESVLSMRDKVATRYFFFIDDRLYKISVAYDPEYLNGINFEDFLGSVAKKYGEQKELLEDDIGALVQGVWETDGTRLRVHDQTGTYKAFLMTFSDIELENKVAAAHDAANKARSGPEVSSDIDDLAMADGTSITDEGEAVKFDLTGSLSPEEAAAAEAQLKASGVGVKTDGTTAKSSKGSSKKGKPTKAERNLKGVQATKAGQDVIIY